MDPITYEVVRHRLLAVVAQQSAVLKNVSGSPLVFEANDCNTGVYLPDGQIAAMGPHIVFHSGSMELVVGNIIRQFEVESDGVSDINEGDIFITNDPYSGALHLPDVTMVEPVIVDGERIGWVGSCCHVLDIGGMTPSSWCPDATENVQEGLILPPTKLVERGRTRSDIWNLILSSSRLAPNLGLDLKAMIAANTHARKGMLRLVDRYGVDVVKAVMATMLDKSEIATRERLRSLPDGVFQARNYFDADGKKAGLHRVEVELTKRDDTLIFDYSRSAEQVPSIVNCTISGLRGGVFASVLPVIAPDIPWNSGVMRAIEIEAPEGLIINCAKPAPCGSATVGGAYMVKNTAHAAVSTLAGIDDVTRSDAMAESTGAIQVLHIGGLNQYGVGFGGALTEALCGGGGATPEADGADFVGPHEILSYQFNNVEGEEVAFPLLWLRREFNTDSGGAGRHHGGTSLSAAWTVHDADFVHGVHMAHSLSMPASTGLHGGLPGSTHAVTVARGTDVNEALATGRSVTGAADLQVDPAQVTVFDSNPGEQMFFPGDVMDWSFHGGGGWGDALDADPETIARDVQEGRISETGARRHYGVVLAEGVVDAAATEAARADVRRQRREWNRALVEEFAPVTGEARVVGDRLRIVAGHVACECGRTLATSGEDWKQYAGHATLTADELGEKVRLHPDLVADAHACPGCGGLLSVEIRHHEDAPLRALTLA
ncbi:hydantoinase B/oxoprolinase family protein [Nocardioides sp. Kera G14]|uniref:hydantoinase B/oxoprolinase family protein n=1 Tax=Nocardioides sp. Kera G14 TaxID=2884264 RepID=UPI001D113ED2|nr:hydantoinase B/oxoprolinase family protein [Nocardioides sp. Kera G14]UDY23394.1 hydantoinase B/oxoprolinase family protein [Nocardioides sp. Kera G14]